MFQSRGKTDADLPEDTVRPEETKLSEDPVFDAEAARVGDWVAAVSRMATGGVFAQRVGETELGRLNGYAVVDMVIAASRVVSWSQALLMAAIVEMAHCPTSAYGQPNQRCDVIDPHAVDELAAALSCTTRGANILFDQAVTLVEDVPLVYEALRAGHIDLGRARIIAEETTLLDDPETRQTLLREVLKGAGGLTPGQLRGRLRREVIAIDPEAAKARKKRAVAGRRVRAYPLADGSAVLSGLNLPPERVQAAQGRIAAIAKALRKAGDARTLDMLRADTMLDLLTGVYTPHEATPTNPEPEPETGPAEAESAEADPDWARLPDWELTEPDPHPEDPDDPPTPTAGPGQALIPLAGDDGRPSRTAIPVPVPPGTVNLHLNLTTLLGLDELPGLVAGWGPILAETSRAIAAAETGPWGLDVTDADGQLIYHDRLHRHPTVDQASYIRARDITCRAPGCAVPAQRCDLDHTIPWSEGGPTSTSNLGCLCNRHHHLKHDTPWTMHQTQPGVFTWTSGLGHSYTRRPEPLLADPGPFPAAATP